MRLLIHHHDLAYVDADGYIWLSANIGRWVNAISDKVDEVGLLLYQSFTKTRTQDTKVNKKNVKLYSLGERKTVWQRILRPSNVRKICRKICSYYDVLLVRGITPHQYLIWRNTPIETKVFFLVGSLEFVFPRKSLTINQIIRFLIGSYRRWELMMMFRGSSLIIANSYNAIQEITEKYDREAQFVPTSSIRKNEFSHLEYRPIIEPIILLYVGRLDYEKGLYELILSLKLLRNEEIPCNLIIVGDKLQPVYSELYQLAIEEGISEYIEWKGRVPFGQELFKIYRGADLFVLPTYSEGFPKVIREAMANCCPVIATNVGGISTMIKNLEHGLLIPPQDASAIVEAVTQLAYDETLRKRIVANAYRLALDYTVESCAEKLATVLESEYIHHDA